MLPECRPVSELARLAPQPRADAHKYTRGHLVVAGGSAAYPGAAVLAARAAERSGAGYVRLAVPQAAEHAVRCHVVSIPVSACSQREGAFAPEAADEVLRIGEKADAIVLGPGMTAGDGAAAFFAHVLAETRKPLVLDADALNLIAADRAIMDARQGCVNILTPHEGEAARLLGHGIGDRAECALELSRLYDATVVLKGPRTLCAGVDGSLHANESGGPELAKAGSGDVLAGMIGAFLTQRLQPLDCATLAVYLHGRAGALAAERVGVLSVVPLDVVENIGPAMMELGALARRAG